MIMIDLRGTPGKWEKQGVVQGMVCSFECKKDESLLHMLVMRILSMTSVLKKLEQQCPQEWQRRGWGGKETGFSLRC